MLVFKVYIAMKYNVRLDCYNTGKWDRGRSIFIELMWLFVSAIFVRSWLPGSRHRRFLLRLFGAKVGASTVIKPGVRVKFPWRLEVGDHSWIGEGAWIDNLASVRIGANVCISQDAYLCTGSHDWTSPMFDLIVKPIWIEDAAWIAARSVVGPGVTVREGAVLGMGSTASKDLQPWHIYSGVPAVFVKMRVLKPVSVA